jgi:hypothetical protein
MKLKHLVLFIISCAVLILSGLPAGSLIALALLFQLLLLINQIAITKTSQLSAFKIFIFSLPTFFFWGGIQSFIKIYFHESNWLFFLMALVITYSLCLIVTLQCVLIFRFLQQAEFLIGPALQKTFNEIQNSKGLLFRTTSLLFILSFVPYLTTDWKLIFSVMATHLILNWRHLKPALAPRL